MKGNAVLAALLLLAGVMHGQEIVINEFLAANDTTAADQNGEYDDWIELYNAGATAVSLSGFHLSDDAGDFIKWTFPDTTLLPDGYLIVWADEDGNQSGLHANFKLSAAGEELYLTDLSATVVDEIAFGAQATDVSFGRYPNGSGGFRSMRPSFAGPNTDGSPGDDSTRSVFGDTTVHRVELQFYVEHWEDSLEYNFEVLDREFMPARLTYDESVILDSIGVRYKGNSSYEQSRNTPKKPFEFDFNRYRDDQTLLGLHRLNLHNGISDPSFMRETIAYSIARTIMPAPRTGFADVYVNGQLIGFYVLVEQIDRVFLSRHFLENGGNLFKVGDNGATLEYRGDEPSDYGAEYELKTNEEVNDWSRLIAMIERLNHVSNEQFADTMQQYLDLDQCLRLLAFNMVLSNFDSYTGSGRNLYLYDDPGSGRFAVFPWDLNESFGVYTNGWDVIRQDVVAISNLRMRPLNRRILENGSLRRTYLQYIGALTAGAAAPDSIAAMADRLRAVVSSHVLSDTNQLYSYQAFLENIENDVYVDIGRLVPGINSFSQARHENLLIQLSSEWVYPGDTDNNGMVNALDVLPVGVYFLETGPARATISYGWSAQRTLTWDVQAATYADANGDGVIDEQDVIGIGLNWGNVHGSSSTSFELNPQDRERFSPHREHLLRVYHSMSGDGEAVRAMRRLLESILDLDVPVPAEFRVYQNFPNPFNGTTTISFSLPEEADVTLTVRNVLGQLVATPMEKQRCAAGVYRFRFSASNLSSGTYFYRLETAQHAGMRTLMVIK